MTVLAVTGHPPWPPLSGGRRREYELLRRLRHSHNIEVCAVDKDAEPGSAQSLLDGPVKAHAFAVTQVKTTTELEARHFSELARGWIENRLRVGDMALVHCEGYFLRHLLPEFVEVPVVIGTQNVEWQLVEQQLHLDGGADRRACSYMIGRVRRRELAELRRATSVVCVTEADAATLAADGVKADVVPDGCDHLPVVPPGSNNVDVVLPGNFAYAPNCDAAEVFCSEVLPALQWRCPHVTVRLVGNQAERRLRHLVSTGVDVVGPVPSMAPHLADAAVVVAPLRVGGGIKVKVLEALYAGTAVVCSPIAAHGFDDHAGALVVEDHWAGFASAVADLLERPHQLTAQRAAAARYAATLPRWDDAANALDIVWRAASGAAVTGRVT